MTTKQADRIIKTGNAVTVRSKFYGETMTLLIIRRDRFSIYTIDGGVYDRADLEMNNRSKTSV